MDESKFQPGEGLPGGGEFLSEDMTHNCMHCGRPGRMNMSTPVGERQSALCARKRCMVEFTRKMVGVELNL